jgi:quinol monooxygenase YgiN
MAGVIHINWYSTGLRAERLQDLLTEIAPVATRYGASAYTVHRNREDRHKFLQTATFENKLDFDRYWTGPEFTDWRIVNGGHWQVPIYPVWNDIVIEGSVEPEAVVNAGWTGTPAVVDGLEA